MLDKVIAYSVRHKLVVGIFTVGLLAWGIYSLTQLPIDAVPDITNNQVQILTSAPSQAAGDIERLVTFPVEQAVTKIPGVEEVRSFSRFGLSVVTVVFSDKTDVYWARQQVSEKLSEARSQIPDGAGVPVLAPVTTGLGEIYQYVIHTEKGWQGKYSTMELRTIQDWLVRRQLLGVEGVADISSLGGYLKQYEIALDPAKLKGMNVSIAEIFEALQKNNQNTGGAYIDKTPSAYYIRSEGLFTSLDDIGQVVIKNTENGTPMLIRDVAQVQFGHAVRYGAMTRNTDGEVVGGLVLMLKGANASKVIAEVTKRIEEIKKKLTEGITIEPFLDRTKLVNNAISTVTTNLVEGALIVIFILVLFLGNLRAGLIVASVIPLAMLFAICLMNLFGVSGNLMSLGAIDFGLIVDGAVIIVEATLHHLVFKGRGRILTQPQMDDEVRESAGKIRNAAAFGEVIILIVYLPLLVLIGVEGKMFKPMAQTVTFAIVGAFILSLTYVPMMCALFLNKHTQHQVTFSDRLITFLQGVYVPALSKALRRPVVIVTAAIVTLLCSLLLFNKLGAEFLPSLDEGDFAIETRLLTGSSLAETISASEKASQLLLERFPNEIKQVVGKIGTSEIPTDPMPMESCDLMVILKNKKEWTRAETKDELAEKMAKELEDLPGVTFGFQQPIQMRFNELMTGARQDVVIKVYGEDLDKLAAYAEHAGRIVSTIKGCHDIYVEKITGLTQIVIRYKRDQLAKFGMNISEVNDVINTAFAGKTAGIVYEGERRFDLVLRLNEENRKSLKDISELYVTVPGGYQVSLRQFADVDFEVAPNQIQRDDAKRRIIVGFNVRGRDVESIVNELRQKIDQELKFEPGYFASYGGAFKNMEEARKRLAVAVPVSLLFILILLYFTFRSVAQSLVIFTAIPLSAIGGILALWVRDMPFSISAGVGFIALFGVAVLNGIVLMSEFNRLKKEGITSVWERISMACSSRLRPVLLTATVASVGFLPMALSHGSGAEVQKPLATVVIGGLISATLLTLFVLPSVYLLIEQKMKSKLPGKNVTLLLLLFLCSAGNFINAQSLSLDSAISLAYRNNKVLQATQLEEEIFREETKAGSLLPKTDITLMVGQYNSFYTRDNNISVSQTIPFPGSFSARRHLAEAQLKSAQLHTAYSKQQLRWRVVELYEAVAYTDARIQLLRQQDSAFRKLSQLTELRYNSGEGTLLAKTSAAARLAEVENKLLSFESELLILQKNLQVITGSKKAFDIVHEPFKQLDLKTDSLNAATGNFMSYMKQQVVVAERERQLQKKAILPDLKLGYFNQSLYGVPLNELNTGFAGANNRFQGFQAGLLVPLWFPAEIHRSRAMNARLAMLHTEYESSSLNFSMELQNDIVKLARAKKQAEYYTSQAIPMAMLIEKQSAAAYNSGDIGYMEFLHGLMQVFDMREGNLIAVHEYNQRAILIQSKLNTK